MRKMHRILGLLAAILTAAALSAATIPNGTRISVRNTTSLNSGTAKVGQSWTGSVNQDVVVNGTTVATTTVETPTLIRIAYTGS